MLSIEEIAAEALRLPAKDRAQLAESLWESLEPPAGAHDQLDEAATEALAKERDRELQDGVVKPISHREMMAKLRR